MARTLSNLVVLARGVVCGGDRRSPTSCGRPCVHILPPTTLIRSKHARSHSLHDSHDFARLLSRPLLLPVLLLVFRRNVRRCVCGPVVNPGQDRESQIRTRTSVASLLLLLSVRPLTAAPKLVTLIRFCDHSLPQAHCTSTVFPMCSVSKRFGFRQSYVIPPAPHHHPPMLRFVFFFFSP